MVIQCDHCRAKFRMDDSKLANGPVKVRCAKCKEIFVVQKEEEPAESFQLPTDFDASSSDATPSAEESPTGFAPEPAGFGFEAEADKSEFTFNMETPSESDAGVAPSVAAVPEETDTEFDWKDSAAFGESGSSAEFDLSGFSAAAETDKPSPGPQAEDSLGEFDFGDIPQSEPVQPTTAAPVPVDDFAVDFGEVSFADAPAAESEPSSFDFSFAPETDQPSLEEPAVPPAAAAGNDDFVLSFDTDSPAPAVAAGEDSGSASFGDFDFGEVEEPAPQVKPAPTVVSPQVVVKPAPDEEVELPPMPLQDDELPPTSLTTRKKRGSLFPLFVIIGAILLIVALAGSGVYLFGGPKVFSKVGLGFLVEWYGQKGGEEGDITLRNIKAEYVVNKEAGELFVVRGEAVNNYKKPRASVQVKVALLGSGGVSLKTKTAFCGNSLSNEQLVSIPLAKIEEVMNNQFGDSLANLGVKPGNAIPFVVVVSGVPKESSDFSVQVGGSTVATQ
jgi:predicted Zn finger-like uncharacterized protein